MGVRSGKVYKGVTYDPKIVKRLTKEPKGVGERKGKGWDTQGLILAFFGLAFQLASIAIPIAMVLLSTVENVASAVRATAIEKGGESLGHPVREAQG